MEEKKDYRLQRKVWKEGRVAILSWTIHNVLEVIKEDTERLKRITAKHKSGAKMIIRKV